MKTKTGRIMVLSNCAVWGNEKLRFIKEREARGILTSLGLRTTISKIPFIPIPILVSRYQDVNTRYKVNEIIYRFLLTRDKF